MGALGGLVSDWWKLGNPHLGRSPRATSPLAILYL